MLVRFTEQQQAICAVLLDSREDRQLMPTDEEISIVEEMIVILKSFREPTEIMSGKKYRVAFIEENSFNSYTQRR